MKLDSREWSSDVAAVVAVVAEMWPTRVVKLPSMTVLPSVW
jgi:hypothetical protein